MPYNKTHEKAIYGVIVMGCIVFGCSATLEQDDSDDPDASCDDVTIVPVMACNQKDAGACDQ